MEVNNLKSDLRRLTDQNGKLHMNLNNSGNTQAMLKDQERRFNELYQKEVIERTKVKETSDT